MAKRKNGEGTYYIRKNGKYKYYAFRFPDGKEIYGHTAQERDEKIKAYAEELKQGIATIDNKYIFADYCRLWLKEHRLYITDRVYDDYESIIDSRVEKFQIGKMQIKSLTVNAFNIYINELAGKYSKATIDKTIAVIKQVLKYGIEAGEIPALNVSKIKRPKETEVKTKRKEVPFMSAQDVKLFIEEIENNPAKYGDATKLLIFITQTGLRLSEATGLQWQYVDIQARTLKIEQTSTRIIERDKNHEAIKKDGKNVYKRVTKGAKSEEGQRVIPLNQKASEILMYFYNKYNHKNNDYVFISIQGKPYNNRTVQRTLESVLNNSKCSRKDYTPHSLRHGFASILIQQKVDIKTVSKLLGHSDVAFTYNTYVGVSQEDKQKAVNVLNDI